MVSKIRSAIGGLVMLATAASAAPAVTNAPVITSLAREVKATYPSRVYVTLKATNLTQNVRYFVNEADYVSGNLDNYTERGSNAINTSTNLNKECAVSFFYDDTQPAKKNEAYFRLATKRDSLPQ